MNPVQYSGEHLWIHYLGHFLILLGFFSALYALVGYLLSNRNNSIDWSRAIKFAYLTHSFALFAVIGLILYMMTQHYFEFSYVWSHVSDELPLKYILTAFWEGQEGSFLLWLFWNCILGFFFLNKKDPVQRTVLIIIVGVNLILFSMLLGFYFGDVRIGSNPFTLLRHTMNIPLFNNAEYVSLIKGNGLNPLLQNYWNIIHPPTLFLGFSSTMIPYAFAFSALIHKEQRTWLHKVLPWALFSGFILGTGILMGGAWAYEALSFGGYWAWDPVENMVLVPWMILIAGIHTNYIARATGRSIHPTLLFYILSFVAICYSTYLTRSGILGDSSAHAFTQMGLEKQLVFLVLATLAFPSYLYFRNRTYLSEQSEEEKLNSRDFWMLIGSLVLIFGAVLITFTTSIPVYNKLLDLFGNLIGNNLQELHKSIPLDPVAHHNQFQLWIAAFAAILSGIALYLKYQSEHSILNFNKFKIHLAIIIVSSILMSGLIYFNSFEQLHWSHTVLLISACFTLCSAVLYLFRIINFRIKASAPVLSHGGFGILLLGILFTGINQQIISSNRFAQEGLMESPEAPDLSKHITLIRNQEMFMNGYWLNYVSDSFVLKSRIYQIDFWQEDSAGIRSNEFTLYPEIQYDNKLTKVAASNPSIKHEFTKDIFSLIASIPPSQMDAEAAQAAEDSLQYITRFLKINDSLETEEYIYKLTGLNTDFKSSNVDSLYYDQKLQLIIEVTRKEDRSSFLAQPGILYRNNLVYKFPSQIDALGMRLSIPDTLYGSFVPDYGQGEKNIVSLRVNDSIRLSDNSFLSLKNISKEIPKDRYEIQENDIGVQATLSYRKNDMTAKLYPLFIIKDSQVLSMPYSSLYPGISLRFVKIEPETELMTFEYIVHNNIEEILIPVDIAENGPRTDFIVIQVILFPWINLVWGGSIIMLLGLLVAAFDKRKLAKNA